MKRFRFWQPFLLVTLGTSCVTSPPPQTGRAGVVIPAKWTAGAASSAPIQERWWESFGSSNLNTLVTEALQHNYDLPIAAARLEASLAQARIAGADLYPSLNAGFDAQRSKRNFIGFPIPGQNGKVLSSFSTTYGISLNTAWEVDVWGRIRSGARAALAEVQASEATFEAVRQSIAAQTVKGWLAVREARLQVSLAENTVQSFRVTAEQNRRRYERGLRDALDLRLALNAQAAAEATLAQNRATLDRATRQLEAFLGRYPAGKAKGTELLPEARLEIPPGLPSELLTRRPDLVAAERRLAAADQRLAQAKASLFPRLSLTASGGTSTQELADLVSSDFSVWTLAANLAQPIFEGGRLRAGIKLSRAGVREALAAYSQAVLKAFTEVETSLAALRLLAEREEHLREALDQARAALRLAEDRYAAGLEIFLTVQEAQRRVFNNETQLLAVRRQRLETQVDLHLALGGGFGAAGTNVDEQPNAGQPLSKTDTPQWMIDSLMASERREAWGGRGACSRFLLKKGGQLTTQRTPEFDRRSPRESAGKPDALQTLARKFASRSKRVLALKLHTPLKTPTAVAADVRRRSAAGLHQVRLLTSAATRCKRIHRHLAVMKSRVQFFLVPLVLVLGVAVAAFMIANRKPVQPKPPEVILPLVRVLTVAPTNAQLEVRSQGTVAPRTAIDLSSEVTGKVASVAPCMAAGGFFEEGEVLVTIDPRDFELSVVQARAQVAAADARLAREQAEAEIARQEWDDLSPGKNPSPLVLRAPQLKEAQAALASAQAALEVAERDLEKTKIRAPFAGRVLSETVDVGQFLNRGTAIARLYGADYAEVRLPVPVEDMAFLDLPLAYRTDTNSSPGPTVHLRGQFAGRENVWSGRVVRTEGEIDPQSRMLTAVAQVADPFARKADSELPPLPMGLFVEAVIMGRRVEKVFMVPRIALRSGDRVLVVDEENKLRFRNVTILRPERDQILLRSGLATGDRVVLSPLNTPVDGMAVRTFDEITEAAPQESETSAR